MKPQHKMEPLLSRKQRTKWTISKVAPYIAKHKGIKALIAFAQNSLKEEKDSLTKLQATEGYVKGGTDEGLISKKISTLEKELVKGEKSLETFFATLPFPQHKLNG